MGLNFYRISELMPLPFNDRRPKTRREGKHRRDEKRNTQRGRVSARTVMELINFLAGQKDEHKDEGTDVRKLAESYEF